MMEKVDMFKAGVQMKYKGRKYIGSVLGGFVTMIFSFYILYYIAILSQQVLLRQNA